MTFLIISAACLIACAIGYCFGRYTAAVEMLKFIKEVEKNEILQTGKKQGSLQRKS